MKKFKVAALAVIMTMLLGTVSSFAAAWVKDPVDPANPQVTVTYEKAADEGYIMTMAPSGISDGYLDLNEDVYHVTEKYKVAHKLDESNLFVGWLSLDDSLYQARIIGETTPAVSAVGTPAQVWTVTYELVPTDKRPSNSEVVVEKTTKSEKKDITKKVYYIKGKKVSKGGFYAAKSSKYKVKTTKKMIRKVETLAKTKKEFLDAEVYLPDGNSDTQQVTGYGKVMKAKYNFCQNRYYKVVKTYKKIYRLVLR